MNSSKRRDEILSTAMEIIFKQGYYKLTIRNMAKQINISEAGIYRHFNNKEEIISELCNLVFYKNQFWNKNISQIDPFELLSKIIMKQLKILGDNPFLSAILFQEEIFSEYPKIKEKFNYHRIRNEKIITEIILNGQKSGAISHNLDPAVFAILYMGSIRIIVLKWRYSNFAYHLEEEAKRVIQQLFMFIRT